MERKKIVVCSKFISRCSFPPWKTRSKKQINYVLTAPFERVLSMFYLRFKHSIEIYHKNFSGNHLLSVFFYDSKILIWCRKNENFLLASFFLLVFPHFFSLSSHLPCSNDRVCEVYFMGKSAHHISNDNLTFHA